MTLLWFFIFSQIQTTTKPFPHLKKIIALPTWQIFLLLIIPAFIPSSIPVGLFIEIIWILLIAYSTYFISNSLYQKLPTEHGINIKRFRYNFLFSISYLVVVFLVFDGGYNINQDTYKEYGWAVAAIIPLHIYAMYGMFYTIWFLAKCISTIENKRAVSFDNYAGYFFMLCFFPVGIWWLHPKIQRILLADKQLA